MKQFFTLLFLFPAIFLMAQPTITNSDLPVQYEIWVNFEETSPSFPMPVAGAGQTWDFTTLTVTDTGGAYFQPEWAMPYGWASLFPGSNLAILNEDDTSAMFLKSQAGGLFLDGFAQIQDSLLPTGDNWADFIPDRAYFPTPLTYMDSVMHASRITMEDSIDIGGGMMVPILITLDFHSVFVADAHGSVITPLGTYNDVLTIRNYTFQYDSFYVDLGAGYTLQNSEGPHDTEMVYMFMKNGPQAMLAEVDYDVYTSTVTSATWYESYTVTSQDESTSSELSFGPNPLVTGTNLQVNGEKGTDLYIFSSDGKFIRKVNLNGGTQQLSTSDLTAGTYTLLTTGNGKVKSKQSFVVTR